MLPETEDSPNTADMLVGHLLEGKKKHDEDKNVESEEVQHLQKGADYLTTFLLQKGIQQKKTVTTAKPPGLDELKKQFVKNLVKNEFVTIADNGRTLLTEKGKKFLDQQTKEAADRVTLVQLKNLRYGQSLARKRKSSGRKTKKGRKTSVKKKKKRR